MFRCINVPMYQCINVTIYQCINVRMYQSIKHADTRSMKCLFNHEIILNTLEFAWWWADPCLTKKNPNSPWPMNVLCLVAHVEFDAGALKPLKNVVGKRAMNRFGGDQYTPRRWGRQVVGLGDRHSLKWNENYWNSHFMLSGDTESKKNWSDGPRWFIGTRVLDLFRCPRFGLLNIKSNSWLCAFLNSIWMFWWLQS